MQIEVCPYCDGVGLATNRKYRHVKYKGTKRLRCLKFYINRKTKEEIPAWKTTAGVVIKPEEYMICQHCKGSGYLCDRLPYNGPLDIGFCNFGEMWEPR